MSASDVFLFSIRSVCGVWPHMDMRAFDIFLVFLFADSLAVPALCRLRSQPQQRFDQKWFGQIRQRVKFCEPEWTYPDGGKHDHRALRALVIDLLRLQPPFVFRDPLPFPTCL